MKARDFELESPMLDTLRQVEEILERYFEIEDWQGVELIMAVACAHYLPGESLWIRFVGPSRSGKTELLRSMTANPDCAELEVLTPASLRGGLKGAPKVLKRLNGKLVLTKDLASIISARREVRNEIFGLLRPIKDGKLTADFGSEEGHLEQEATFDWIIATTPYIEQQRQLEGFLGERFIDIRWRPGNREEMAYLAEQNNAFLSNIRKQLSANVLSLMCRVKELAKAGCTLTEQEMRMIAKYADVTALMRTPVVQDRYGNITVMPQPEVGTELAQGFSRIVCSLKLLELDWEPYIKRLSWDCVPAARATILKCLKNQPKSVSDIATETGMPERTIYYHIEQLQILKVTGEENGLKKIIINLP